MIEEFCKQCGAKGHMNRAYRTICDGCGEEIKDDESEFGSRNYVLVDTVSPDKNKWGQPMGRQLHLHARCAVPYTVRCDVCGAVAGDRGNITHDAEKHGAAPRPAPTPEPEPEPEPDAVPMVEAIPTPIVPERSQLGEFGMRVVSVVLAAGFAMGFGIMILRAIRAIAHMVHP